MYKRFTLDELSTIQNEFIPHLYRLIQLEKCQNVNDFFKIIFVKGSEVMFFDRGDVSFRISLEDKKLHFFDEKDKIEIEVPADDKGALNNLVMRYINHKQRQTGQKTVKAILGDCFLQGKFTEMLDKPYLVYDVETSLVGGEINLNNYPEFYIGYYMEEKEAGKAEYTCITQENLAEFVDKMLGFDGYIVGFNHIYFDNPVCVYNAMKGKSSNEKEEAIKKLNEKSLDLFVFVQRLTGRRMGLNKLSDNLVGIQKNLEGGGASVETLWKARKSGTVEALNQIKAYCENDVRMTLFLFYYLLYFKKMSLDGEEFTYELADFLKMANAQGNFEGKTENTHGQTALF